MKRRSRFITNLLKKLHRCLSCWALYLNPSPRPPPTPATWSRELSAPSEGKLNQPQNREATPYLTYLRKLPDPRKSVMKAHWNGANRWYELAIIVRTGWCEASPCVHSISSIPIAQTQSPPWIECSTRKTDEWFASELKNLSKFCKLFLTFHTHNLINRDIRALQANMS